MTARKVWAFRLLATVFTLVSSLAAMELMARLYIGLSGRNVEAMKPLIGYARPGRVEPHPFLPLVLSPDTDFDMQIEYPLHGGLVRWRYTTNADGFRGRAVSKEKGPTTYRILTLGGSATFGDGVDDDQTWSARLEAMLQTRHPDRTIEVLNFGVPTATSAHSLSLLALRGVHYQPDLVIYYEGGNDIHCCLGYLPFQTDYSHALEHYEGLSPWLISLPRPAYNSYAITVLNYAWNQQIGNTAGNVKRENLERAGDRLLGLEAVLSNIVSMQAIAAANGADFILSTYHWYRPGETEARYNQALRQLATERNMYLVDQAGLIPTEDPAVHLDDVHFTVYGDELMATNYFDYIEANELVP
ncbi:MAG: GDSL-type esterase/lipase family protein [Chloroflexi bacterium]|nr:GDSL-type esterase/lipase family protein [Chloroflexota bacterium]MCI0578392.1 GDSL-type esterase/lipase family protein [Chloroflexota bacterium]MCI0647611.1 GDSL-type esterase/lipase family protein [Chloroflexota bacterium]MCI0730420.1 GDSL-type esterase/lipase family protein [Chloroflexota bacterium]